MAGDAIRWGIISSANIAQKALIPAIDAAGNAELAMLGTRHGDRVAAVREQYEFALVPSYDAVLASDVDAVYIPLPNGMHADWAIRALEAGKHVLCEKPLALNPDQALAMIDAARRTGLLLAEAFMYRFHPQIEQALKLLREKRIGELRLVRTCFSFNAAPDEANPRFQHDQGPGALLDVGCYCINATRLFSGGPPLAVSAWGSYHQPSGGDLTTAAILEYPGHAGLFDCSFQASSRSGVELVGDSGVLELPRPWLPSDQPGKVILRTALGSEEFATPAANHYQLMVEDFSRAIQEHKQPRWTAEDALENMRVIEAVKVASRQGRRVLMEEIVGGRAVKGPVALF